MLLTPAGSANFSQVSSDESEDLPPAQRLLYLGQITAIPSLPSGSDRIRGRHHGPR